MRLSQMRYFQSACQYRNLSKAAEALHISQPSISIAIRDLEEEFGIALFLRKNKQLILTEAGEYFLSQINSILQEVDLLESHMISLGKAQTGVRIDLLPITGSYLLMPVLTSFQKAYPHIKISLKESSAHLAKESLEKEQCDVALTIVEQLNSNNFDGIVLEETEFFYCVDKSHPSASSSIAHVKDLCDSNLILLQDDSFLTKEIRKRFVTQALVPNVILYALHLPLILDLLSTGESGTFLPKELAQTFPNIVAIPLEEPLQVTYALIWKRKKHHAPDVNKFIQYFCERYPKISSVTQNPPPDSTNNLIT